MQLERYQRCLDELPRAEAAFDSYRLQHMSPCLPETRVDLLNDIMEWCSGSADRSCIFWLSGMAGMGKSTIALTIAKECAKKKQLGASFFFSKGNENLNNARRFFTTVAFQLASRIPDLKPLVCEAITNNPDIYNKMMGEQWNHLILTPLTRLKGTRRQTLVVVIDALDECDGEEDVQLIVRLLFQANNLPAAHFKVFITSRPETPIQKGFSDMAGIRHRSIVLQNVPRSIVDKDIAIYFRQELKDVGVHSRDIEHLVEKAGGLFIWAATACRFIHGAHILSLRNKRLSLLLGNGKPGKNPEEELDKMYASILSGSIKGNYDEEEREEVFQLFRRVVGAIVLLFNPLSIDTLSRLLNVLPGEVNSIISNLSSVLNIPDNDTGPIRVLHLSFRDFLLSTQRCPDEHLRV